MNAALGETRGPRAFANLTAMKLYVCWGTFGNANNHPCHKAHQALLQAGIEHEVVKTYGCYGTDPLFPGRRRIREMTGNYKVPVLELDDGALVDGSGAIVDWASTKSAHA
jgi:glutathione S-transferase